ncbi:MAG: flavodoxin FldB [Marinagarivorans sp.]|nr:flavodoxin FldB [Marinagarivorans sp.]
MFNAKNSRRPIGLFYGSSTCYTQMSADKIAAQFNEGQVDIFNIADEPLNSSQFYDYLIFGIPTWDYGELQEDWEDVWEELDSLDLKHCTVALYGQGDQEGYPEWFLDAMGYLHHKLQQAGARMVGYWPIEGYDFEGSKALTDDGQYFVGLALDDETQFSQSEQRIREWCLQLQQDYGFPIHRG